MKINFLLCDCMGLQELGTSAQYTCPEVILFLVPVYDKHACSVNFICFLIDLLTQHENSSNKALKL